MKLLESITLGKFTLPNRIAMAPLTRSRADGNGIQGPFAAKYYQQRASAGLIISEATAISHIGRGYPRVPGIWSEAQIEAWKPVTEAVHEVGGHIILQLWHTGRFGHSSLQPNGPVSSSDVQLDAEVRTATMTHERATRPRPLTVDEIKSTVEDYATATKNAKIAGFDGVQIHGANGYLIDQFLRDGVNKRTDDYGGSVESRIRFLLEVTDAVVAAAGDSLVSLRLSPGNTSVSVDSDWQGTFLAAAAGLRGRGLHLLEVREDGEEGRALSPKLAEAAGVKLCVNQSYHRESALEAVDSGRADMVAFGVPYIANPDLVERIRLNAPWNDAHKETFYYGGEEGYTDYPFLGR